MKRLIVAAICVVAFVGLVMTTGCETVSGMGKDLNNGILYLF